MPVQLFQKGNCANPNGRPKGSKDKIRYNAGLICQQEKFNPIIKLIELAKEGKSQRIQLEAASELASYVCPKLKAIEVSLDDAKETFQFFLNTGVSANSDHGNGENEK